MHWLTRKYYVLRSAYRVQRGNQRALWEVNVIPCDDLLRLAAVWQVAYGNLLVKPLAEKNNAAAVESFIRQAQADVVSNGDVCIIQPLYEWRAFLLNAWGTEAWHAKRKAVRTVLDWQVDHPGFEIDEQTADQITTKFDGNLDDLIAWINDGGDLEIV